MAAAIGCIVGQGLLLVVAYVAVTRYARDVLRPAPVPRVDPQLDALRTDLHSLAVKLGRAESRVSCGVCGAQ